MTIRKLILFDIDGTLLHSKGATREAKAQAMIEVFGTASSVREHHFGGKTDWQILHEVLADGGVPILCGGTGLYLRTLLDGIAPVPEICPDIRAAVRKLTADELHLRLREEDSASAARLGPRDIQRMSRALEVVRSTGEPLATWQARKSGGIAAEISLHPLIVLPEREWLYERCDRRFALMWAAGALDEVRALLERDLAWDAPVMRAIGVPEIAAYLADEMQRDEAIELGQRATRQYAKRQYTWFRNQPPPDWPRSDNKTIAEYDFFVSLFQGEG